MPVTSKSTRDITITRTGTFAVRRTGTFSSDDNNALNAGFWFELKHKRLLNSLERRRAEPIYVVINYIRCSVCVCGFVARSLLGCYVVFYGGFF